MLHREIPFLRICIPLCAGIVIGLFFDPGYLFILLSFSGIAVLFIASLKIKSYTENTLYGIPVSLSFFLLGLLLYRNEKNNLSYLPPEPALMVCTLSDYPAEKPNTSMLTVKLKYKLDRDQVRPLRGSMVLYHKNDASLSFTPGDMLIVRCTPSEISNRGNPYEFNYKFYMENLGIKYYSFTDSRSIINYYPEARKNIRHRALIIRHKIIEMYRNRGISDERLPLVSALTLGEKSGLDRDQKENFIRAGVMHIMAVSGLHAVILSLFVLNLLFFLKRKFNFLRILISVLFLWCFAFVTGLTPSVLRATLMFSFVQAGSLMHRKVNGINSVLASAFVLILIRPSVIFDAGFLLSYSAVIFIVAFYKGAYLLLNPGGKIADWIWQSVVVTTVAQLGTLSLSVMLFNRFPVWFILTNIVIVPLSSLAIILGCIIPVLYPFPAISGSIGFILDWLTRLTEMLTEIAAQLPFAGLTGIGMTVTGCILLFCFNGALMKYITDRKRQNLHVVLFLLLMWAAASTFTAVRTKTTSELIVYNMNGNGTIGIRTGKHLNIYSDTLVTEPEINRHRSAAGLRVNFRKIENGILLLEADNKSILFCRPSGMRMINNYNPDIIIVDGFSSRKTIQIAGTPERIIVNSGTQPFIFDHDNLPPVHYIRKSGAYRCRL